MRRSLPGLRKALRVTQQDVGVLMKRNQGFISRVENHQRDMPLDMHDRLYEVINLLSNADLTSTSNPWLDDEQLHLEADNWRVDELSYLKSLRNQRVSQLQEMETTYKEVMQALHKLHHLLEHVDTPSELVEWINIIHPRLRQEAMKNGPRNQAKLRLFIDGLDGQLAKAGADK